MNHVQSCPFLPANVGTYRLRKTSYSDLGLGEEDGDLDAEEGDEDGGGTTADESHSDYDTDTRKKASGGADDDNNGSREDVARVSDVDLLITARSPAQGVQAQQPRQGEYYSENKDSKSASSSCPHYDLNPKESSDSKKKEKKLTAANLRRAFFSELSPRPETVEEEQEYEENENGRESRGIRRKKSKESSFEKSPATQGSSGGGDPNTTEFDASTGSPSKVSLLGLGIRKGVMVGKGGIRAVLFGHHLHHHQDTSESSSETPGSTSLTSRARTKSLDVTALPEISLTASSTSTSKPSRQRRRVSSAQVQNLKEEEEMMLLRETGHEVILHQQHQQQPKPSSLACTLPSEEEESHHHRHSSTSSATSVEKYPRRRSSSSGSKQQPEKTIPGVKPSHPPPPPPARSSSVSVHIESDV